MGVFYEKGIALFYSDLLIPIAIQLHYTNKSLSVHLYEGCSESSVREVYCKDRTSDRETM